MQLVSKLKKLENRKATTARIAIWYTFSNVFAKGIAVLSTPLFTRLLTKAEYGEFSNFTSWESILFVLVTLDFTTSIARAKYDFDDRMNEYISTILLMANIITLVSWGIIEVNQSFFTKLFSMDISFIRLMFVNLLFSPAYSFLHAKQRVYRKYIFFVIFSMTTALLRTGISVLLVLLMKDKLMGRIIGYVIPISVFNFGLWLYTVVKGKKIKGDCLKFACMISVPMIMHALSSIILGSSDRIMIKQICGSEQTALYTLAYQVSMLANLVWNSMNQAWAPWLYDNIHADNRKAINRNSKIYLGTFAVLVIGILLLSPEIILIMGGQKYYEARYVMPPVIMGCAFQFVYAMYVNLEIYNKKTYLISIATVCAAAINIGLNYWLIPRYGYIAAAYTTLIGFALQFAFHYISVRIWSKDLSKLYSRKFIFGILGGLLVLSALSLIIYDYSVIRYILIGVYMVLLGLGCYKYRHSILKLLGAKFVKKRKQEKSDSES